MGQGYFTGAIDLSAGSERDALAPVGSEWVG